MRCFPNLLYLQGQSHSKYQRKINDINNNAGKDQIISWRTEKARNHAKRIKYLTQSPIPLLSRSQWARHNPWHYGFRCVHVQLPNLTGAFLSCVDGRNWFLRCWTQALKTAFRLFMKRFGISKHFAKALPQETTSNDYGAQAARTEFETSGIRISRWDNVQEILRKVKRVRAARPIVQN